MTTSWLARPFDMQGQFQEEFRRRVALILMILGAVFLLVFAPIDYVAGLRVVAIANLLLSILLLGSIAYLARGGQVASIARLNVGAFLVWFLVTVPTTALMTIWFPMFPLVAFFALGRREGLLWSLGFLLSLLLEYVACRRLGIYIASDLFLVSTLASLALVVLSVLYYQRLLELLQHAVARQFRQLQHAQRLESIAVLAGGIAHDFNNLLVGIMGNLELMQMDMAPEHPHRRRLDEMMDSSVRAQKLVRQLLDFAGRGGWGRAPIDLNALLHELRPSLRAVVGSQAVLEFEIDKPLRRVRGDRRQLEQALLNLVANACEAARSDVPCCIRIATGMSHRGAPETMLIDAIPARSRDGAFVFLRVSDNGRGIPEDVQARVFDPFFTTKSAGSGLGLAAVAGIVRGMGGGIQLHSRMNEGATFTLWFPAQAEAAETTSTRADVSRTELPRLDGTVLIVDPDRIARGIARKMLEAAGLTVLEAADDAAMHRSLQNANGIDVVLMERSLSPPRSAPVRVIFCGGAEALPAGAQQPYVRKPYRIHELLACVARCLAEGEG
ncbi:MAG: hypothetical protein D6678_07050 [Zetaproteobacteria bacterium]|nr:MAG: hypothetical protein D6678_07050 [Zetaproteobacteria bacterium]